MSIKVTFMEHQRTFKRIQVPCRAPRGPELLTRVRESISGDQLSYLVDFLEVFEYIRDCFEQNGHLNVC